jgi:L-iditol 2-dehydrogenase
MKRIEIIDKRKCEIVNVPTPCAKDDWAVVKIIAAPMCTEYKQFENGISKSPLGHEAAGEVVEVARQCNVKVGDRVVVMPQYPCGKCSQCLSGEYIHCQNNIDFAKFTGSEFGSDTFAQYIIKPSWLLPIIPDGISFENASMICCGLGPTFGAMERMCVNPLDNVLVTGLGPVGLGCVINALYRNANVIAVSRNKYRSNLAKEIGAQTIINPDDSDAIEKILELTEGKGVDVSIDCSGDAKAQRLIVDATGRNGKIAFCGESSELKIMVSNDLIRKGLTLYGIWHYNLNGVSKLFKTVKYSVDKLDKMITHQFQIDKIGEAWELQLTRQCGKVILYPW